MTDRILKNSLSFAADYLQLAADRSKQLSWPGTEQECRKALSRVELLLVDVESGRVIELEKDSANQTTPSSSPCEAEGKHG